MKNIQQLKNITHIVVSVVLVVLMLILFASIISRNNSTDDMEQCMYTYKDYQYCIERVTGNENNN